ncbi:DEAD/DEAH box helicase family protein [Salinibacter altiplanensis]|uniref:DEAD/DEAH box helicase family protein n=1 Tax=Salinibacter altiplanensis TaxID=1803181 RepID=UPI001F3ADAA1|nr:DEAD/DEAH box helicase family protein [Salinibacter altiplanensis]
MDRSRHIPEAVRRRVEYFDGQTCRECGRTIDGEILRKHLDHRTAFSDGGAHAVFNLDPLCHTCNQEKGDRSTERTRALRAQHDQQRTNTRRYFQDADASIAGNDQLRTPQEEGYLALRDYFDAERTAQLPAIVVLPTGCGKSGLIACAPFGVAEGRVLVVAPNLTIKDGLAEGTFSGTGNFYQFCDVLPPDVRLPRVVALERGRVNEEDCRRADVIVANVQQLQGWLPLFPPDFFDLVMVDEAHHAPADSWQNVNRAFPDAKKIYCTATPFRSDERPIRAEPVYRYPLADAINAGYVKNIVRVDAVASEMTFTVEGDEQSFTHEEIMNLRAETWFSRGVALSDVCNETIVDRSVQLLRAKNRRGTQQHQILAAACSIRHAERVAALYRSRDVEASFVASRGMTTEDRERRLRAYEHGDLDAMVHVGILGEGYDNKHISIAALFRPFRSVAPYTQFVGRALRALPDGTDTDNLAHVVAHAGLNQEGHWQYFKHETEEAQVLADLDARAQAHEEDGADGPEEPRSRDHSDNDPAQVTSEEIEGFDVDAYLPVEGAEAEEAEEHLNDMEEALEGLREKGLDVPDADDIKQEIAERNQPLGDEDLPPPSNRPARERHAHRKILNHAVRRAAGTVLHQLDLPAGDSLVGTVGQGDEESNVEVVIRMLHRRVNAAVGRDDETEGRNAWPLTALKAAKEHIPEIRSAVRTDISATIGDGTEEGAAPAPSPLNQTGQEDGPSGDTWTADDVDWGNPFSSSH